MCVKSWEVHRFCAGLSLRAWVVASCCLLTRAVGADGPPTPEESLAALRLADPALEIRLVAREPDVVSPVALAWDEHGALFVVEMTDYPSADTGGRVKRLEDRDGDGRYERVTVFADGLKFPSGVLPWNGGVLVTAAPNLWHFRDTDGDGRADVRRVVLTGFTEGNQQLRVNSPTWGRDNWVYLANGRSGGAVRRPDDPPGRALPIPRNDLRVRPATGEAEPVSGFSQFGLPRDDWGDRFPSWNTVPARHVVLDGRRVGPNPADFELPTPAEILDLSDGGRVYSLAPSQRRFNAESVSYFNATCGPIVLRGGGLGEGYRGHWMVCEPLSGLVHHRRLEPAGPTYNARRVESGTEFLASAHPWFRPVNLAEGPDGALYVADFCRAWVEHPAFVPPAQRNSVDFREGHDRGRLWRISRKDAKPGPRCRPGGDTDPATLVAHFGHPDAWCRDTAQRLLVERGGTEAVSPLRSASKASRRDLARAHALWTLEGLNALDDATLRDALRDPSARVREQAVRLAAGRGASLTPDLAHLADDTDVRVRLQAVVALGPVDSDVARDALARVAARDGGSPWTARALLLALDRPGRFLSALLKRQPTWLTATTEPQAQVLVELAEAVGSHNGADDVGALRQACAGSPGSPGELAVQLGLARVGGRGVPQAKAGGGVVPTTPLDESTVKAAFGLLGSVGSPPWQRVLALDLLTAKRAPGIADRLIGLLDPSTPPALQTAAARAFASVGSPELADRMFPEWDRFALSTRRILMGTLAGNPALAGRLVDAVGQGTVSAEEVDATTREALRRFTDPVFQARLNAVFRSRPESDRAALVRRYEPALAKTGDIARGRALFEKHCQTCHTRTGGGAKVGPDLLSVAGRPPLDLLTAVLDPSREVAPDGVAVVVATTRGETLTGLLAGETPAGVRLRRAEGIETIIPRDEVEAVRPTGRSLMPEGFEQSLDEQAFADLLSFLRSPVRP